MKFIQKTKTIQTKIIHLNQGPANTPQAIKDEIAALPPIKIPEVEDLKAKARGSENQLIKNILRDKPVGNLNSILGNKKQPFTGIENLTKEEKKIRKNELKKQIEKAKNSLKKLTDTKPEREENPEKELQIQLLDNQILILEEELRILKATDKKDEQKKSSKEPTEKAKDLSKKDDNKEIPLINLQGMPGAHRTSSRQSPEERKASGRDYAIDSTIKVALLENRNIDPKELSDSEAQLKTKLEAAKTDPANVNLSFRYFDLICTNIRLLASGETQEDQFKENEKLIREWNEKSEDPNIKVSHGMLHNIKLLVTGKINQEGFKERVKETEEYEKEKARREPYNKVERQVLEQKRKELMEDKIPKRKSRKIFTETLPKISKIQEKNWTEEVEAELKPIIEKLRKELTEADYDLAIENFKIICEEIVNPSSNSTAIINLIRRQVQQK